MIVVKQHRLPHCLKGNNFLWGTLVPSLGDFGTVSGGLWYRLFAILGDFGTVSLILLIPSKGIRTGKRRLETGLFPLTAMKDNVFPLTGKEKTAYPPQDRANYAGVSIGQTGDLIPLNGHNYNIFRKYKGR